MAFRAIAYFAATALLVQMAYSQQCGCGYTNQVAAPVSIGNSLGYGSGISLGNIGYSGINTGCGGSVGYSGSSNIGNLGNQFSQGQDALSISVGSSYAPTGISVTAENLEVGGQLLVNGQLPILGTVATSGNIPTGGQGQVQYSTAPGVGLTFGACGYGQPTSVPNVGYGNSGLVGNNGLGVVGNSGLGIGLGQGGGCGCGYVL